MVTSSKHGSKHSSKHGSKHAGFSRRLAPRCDYFTWFKVQFWLLIKLRNTEITSDIWEVFVMFRVSESCAVLRRRLATLSCNHPVSPFAGSCYFTDHRRNPLCVSGRRLRSLPLVSLSCRLSFLKYLFSRFSFFFFFSRITSLFTTLTVLHTDSCEKESFLIPSTDIIVSMLNLFTFILTFILKL